ncbi:MAG: hypothetical protein MUC36_15750 [Planctomycetes bacterium]|jgi:hypothetical protein|nr:hypothetical protein [Planctomycetota bacterium]
MLNWWWRGGWCLAMVMPLSAQAAAVSWRELPGAGAVAVGVVFEHGVLGPGRAGPPGAAAVLANCRLLLARAAVPSLQNALVHVDDELHCIVGVLPADDPAAAIAFVEALFGDGAQLGDDQIVREVARLALAADDAAFLFPGDVLHARVRAQLLGRGLPRGDSQVLLALTATQVRELLRVPVDHALGGVGPTGPVVAALRAWPAPPPDPDGWSLPPAIAAVAGAGAGSEVHARVDAPLVVVAFPVAAAVHRPALAVGLEVLRARAMRVGSGFAPRGNEWMARAPLIAWSWLAGEQLVRFHRRGFDAVQLLRGEVLRGAVDAAAEGRATAAELDSLLAAARATPPTAAEVATAQRTLLGEFGFEVAAERQVDAALLAPWTVVHLLGPRRGIEAAAIAAVDVDGVQRALAAVLVESAAARHTLLPAPAPNRVWKARP